MLGAITAVAEQSPAITWARDADVLAFVYYEQTDHSIWKVKNPRSLKKAPHRDPVAVAEVAPGNVPAAAPSAPADPTGHLQRGTVRDSLAARQSFYRPTSGNQARASAELPANIPGIDNCRQCHAPASVNANSEPRGGVRFDCVECHRYHNGERPLQGLGAAQRDPPPARRLGTGEFLRGLGTKDTP